MEHSYVNFYQMLHVIAWNRINKFSYSNKDRIFIMITVPGVAYQHDRQYNMYRQVSNIRRTLEGN